MSYEITPFHTRSGIYFENVGIANLVNDRWKIVVYYDLEDYWSHSNTIHEAINKLAAVNAQMEDSAVSRTFFSVFQQIRRKIMDIDTNNEFMYHFKGNNRRKREAYFPIVGQFAHSVFGVLDDRFAEKYEDDIAKFKNNQDHLLHLIKNQTSIIDTTVNILKHSFSDQITQIEQHINEIIDNLNHALADMEKRQHLHVLGTNLALNVIMLIDDYKEVQQSLFEALTDTRHGKFNLFIIKPEQMQEQLSIIRNNIPSGIVPPDADNLEIYSLMKTSAKVTKNHIIFEISIPLMNREPFQIFRIYPLPTRHENEFVYIEPTTKYLLVDVPDAAHYYPANDEDFQACRQRRMGSLLCEQAHPIYSLSSKVSECEIKLLNNAEMSPSCTIRKTDKNITWIQLHHTNRWIFSLDREYTLPIICGKSVSNVMIKGEGILQLNKQCTVKHGELTMQTKNDYYTNAGGYFTPMFNISNLINFNPNETISHKSLDHVSISKTPDQRILELEQRIDEVKKLEKLPENVEPEYHYQFQLGGIYVFILLLALYLACKCIFK